MPMGDYLTKIKNPYDKLKALVRKVSNIEQILVITNCLDEEYESLVIFMATQQTLPDLQFVHSAFLTHEGREEQQKAIQREYTMNYASTSENKGQNKSTNNHNRP